jgi:hypothetical protein
LKKQPFRLNILAVVVVVLARVILVSRVLSILLTPVTPQVVAE